MTAKPPLWVVVYWIGIVLVVAYDCVATALRLAAWPVLAIYGSSIAAMVLLFLVECVRPRKETQ